ncbi:MAG: alpha/beta hydrolase fold domain-containing protein, partial [Planctomycetia bacterium]|nr:alpha/beta hydrolase fold domain-containing protein [Planctomycetia bacterium]
MKKRVSWWCRLIYEIIRIRGSKEFYSKNGEDFWDAVMRKRPKRGSRPGRIHRALFWLLGWKFTEGVVAGFPVFTLKSRLAQKMTRKLEFSEKSETLRTSRSDSGSRLNSGLEMVDKSENAEEMRTILYLHGGGYVDEMLWLHWEFLWRLLWKTGAEVVVPQYPLAPEFHCMDAMVMIREVYRNLLERVPAENVILMGDSAGGGLTLTCAMDFRNEGLPQPRHLVMISPGLEVSAADIETDMEARELEMRDPMLSYGSFS